MTLDDVQLWVVDGLDGALDQLERLSDAARGAIQQLQDTQVGRAAASGLDDVLSRLEDATAYYLPLPPTLREYSRSLCYCGQHRKCMGSHFVSSPAAVWCVLEHELLTDVLKMSLCVTLCGSESFLVLQTQNFLGISVRSGVGDEGPGVRG